MSSRTATPKRENAGGSYSEAMIPCVPFARPRLATDKVGSPAPPGRAFPGTSIWHSNREKHLILGRKTGKNMNRREFGLAGIGAIALAGAIGMEGCDVWSSIEEWVPVGIAAFEQIVTLVAPVAAPGINAIAETVKAAFSVLAAAVDQYINAPADQKTTLLQKVILAFELVSQNLQNFLNAINLPGSNPLVKTVLGLVNIILSTIMGFVNQINPKAASQRTLTLAGESTVVTPVVRSRAKFKSDWNAACIQAGHPESEVN